MPELSMTRTAVNSRRWRAAHPDRVKELARKYGGRGNRKHSNRRAVLKAYGLTAAAYDALLAHQGGVCAVCRRAPRSPKIRNLCIDHDHATERVRGLLCRSCNAGLGQFADSPTYLEAAAEYLRANAKAELVPKGLA